MKTKNATNIRVMHLYREKQPFDFRNSVTISTVSLCLYVGSYIRSSVSQKWGFRLLIAENIQMKEYFLSFYLSK